DPAGQCADEIELGSSLAPALEGSTSAQADATNRDHPEPRVIRQQWRVAGQVYRVELVSVKDASHQLRTYSMALELGQKFQPRNEGREDSVTDHIHESDDTTL